jgi:hypothetical protein
MLTDILDTLPADLDLLLRANRPDPTLPDSAGQVWTQLRGYQRKNPKAFQDHNAVQEMMRS